MKKLFFVLLIIPFFGLAQSDTTKYNKSANYGDIFRRVKAYNFLLPNDTTNFKYGFAAKGTTAYIGNGTSWTAVSGGGGGSTDSTIFATRNWTNTNFYNKTQSDVRFKPIGYNPTIADILANGNNAGGINIDNLGDLNINGGNVYIDGTPISGLYYPQTNPSNYIGRTGLSFASGSGAYNSTTGVITIPTNTSQLTNGAGYLIGSDLAGYATTSSVNTGLALKANDNEVVKLAGSQTITGAKTATSLLTLNANGLAATQDTSKGLLLSNTTSATAGVPVQIAPAIVFESKVVTLAGGGGAGGGVGGTGTSNTMQFKIEHRPVSGTQASNIANNLVISQKFGTNAYADIATFTKDGLQTTISTNEITLGSSIAPSGVGRLNLRSFVDNQVVGRIQGNASILNIQSPTNGIMTFGQADNGMYYAANTGLFIGLGSVVNQSPLSRLVVGGGSNANVSIGANIAAPTNGLAVAGESVFTSTRTAYTGTGVNLTLTASHSVVGLTASGLTATLPTAVGITGRTYTIKLTSSGTGTVATTSSQTIDGSTTYSLASQYKYVSVQSDGANWNIIGNN